MSELLSVRVLPEGVTLRCEKGTNLFALLRDNALAPESFCGGGGSCGKCAVLADGERVLSCRSLVERDMCVTVPTESRTAVLTDSFSPSAPEKGGERPVIAFDIGTTTVVCYLCAGGEVLASAGELNPQTAYGADVVSRLRSAVSGTREAQTALIRRCMNGLVRRVCRAAAVPPEGVGVIAVVGNPAMQQLFLGLDVHNLLTIPFTPVLRRGERCPAGEIFPECTGAELLTVPDVSGYIGADTVACVLSTGMAEERELTLMIDIGTNGEMVLGSRDRLMACATAAGPALEGASITFGMRCADGAIDRVRVENGAIRCHVVGGGEAKGICGSGLIDAAAAFLELGRLDKRGRILPRGDDRLTLCDGVYLSQNDIRQLQLAKGAIAAGIRLLTAAMGAELGHIERVYLAGAFGSFLSPESACRIGLIPAELLDKIRAVGNAAGLGAQRIAAAPDTLIQAEALAGRIELLELAAQPDFQREFAKNMYFDVKETIKIQ